MRRTVSLIVLAATVSLSSLAHAQAAPPAPQTSPGGGADQMQPTAPAETQADSGLADIVVTAQRQSENVQRAAIAISVIQPAALAQVTSPQQLTMLAPAVQISQAGGAQPIFYVRGVGTFAANPYTDSAVAVNYDGIYLARPTSTSGLFYDLDRIEVLKGPQGTLYGRNATGGALNIIPAAPKLGERSISASIGAGNYDSVNAQAAVNLSISDTTAIRLSGLSYTHDAYNTDGTYTEQGAGGRAQILFEPSSTLSIRIAGDYFDLGGTGPTGSLLALDNPRTGVAQPANLEANVGLFDPRSMAILNSAFVPVAGNTFGPFPNRPRLNNQTYGLNGEIKADLGFTNLTVVASWRKADLDTVLLPGPYDITQKETDEQYSIEARLNGKAGSFDWLVGGYAFRDTIDSKYSVNINYLGVNQDFDQVSKSYATFGRLTWNIADTLRLTGALRQTWDDRRFDGLADQVTGVCVSPTHVCPEIRRLPGDIADLPAALASIGYARPPGFPVYVDIRTGSQTSFYAPSQIPVNASTSANKLTYRAGIELEPRPATLLYASVETGYRGGGFSFSTIRPTFAPETITAYTVGAKNRFLDNRLQINLEGFVWKYKDQQISHQTFGATGNLEFITENVGASTNKGVEVEIVAKPLRNTILRADVQYLDARNDRFVFTAPDLSASAGLPAGTIPPAEQCNYTVNPAASTYTVDCSGQRALRSPKWTLNLGVQQTVPLGGGYDLILEGDTHYQSSSIVMFERRAFSTLGSYWLSNVSATLRLPAGHLSVTGFINNVENKRVLGNSFFNSFMGLTTGNFGPPRTYGARLNFKF